MKPFYIHNLLTLYKRVFLCLVFLLSINVQAQNKFQKLYARKDSTNGASAIGSVKQLSDGSFILAGDIDYCHNCQFDNLIVKTDANGDTLWTKIMGGTRDDFSAFVIQLADGNYLFTGTTQSFGHQATANIYGAYIYAVKTNTNGDTLWTKIYGGTNTDNAHNNNISDLQTTLDGGYIILGNSNISPTTAAKYKPILIKCNANGDTLWTKMYLPKNKLGKLINLNNIIQTPIDSGYMVVGSLADTSGGIIVTNVGEDGLVAKLDKWGNVVWSKTYGASGSDLFSGVATCGSGYIVTGNTASFRGDDYMYTLKLDSVGDTLWTKIYGPVLHGNYFEKQNDTSFVIFGYASLGGILAVKINDKGTNTFTQVYNNNGIIGEPNVTNDGGYIIPGRTTDYGSWYGEGLLIKADGFGNSGCYQGDSTVGTYAAPSSIKIDTINTMHFPISVNSTQTQITSGVVIGTVCSNVGVEQFANNTQIKIYPNPAQNKITIDANHVIDVKLFDVIGNQIISTNQTQVDVSNLTDGVYFVQVKTTQSTSTQKIIVQH
jgi:hypothetical protein